MIVDSSALFRLDGRVAIVTGASSGLGARFAQVLHGAGAQVVLAARRLDRLESLAAELRGAVPVACDMGVAADVDRLVSVALERCGRIDILVNNAGIGVPEPAEEESLEQFRRTVDVNLVGLFQLTQGCGRVMIDQGAGVVVNVASIMGMVSVPPIANAAYCATKGAVITLTKELGVQWARKGVRVNAIAPGWFRSEMTTEMFDSDHSMAFIERNTPMARGGAEHELDGALLYLASDASSFVTGHTLVVDGGWVAR